MVMVSKFTYLGIGVCTLACEAGQYRDNTFGQGTQYFGYCPASQNTLLDAINIYAILIRQKSNIFHILVLTRRTCVNILQRNKKNMLISAKI